MGESAPKPTPLQRRERAVTDALRTAIRDLFEQRYHADPAKLDEMAFDLSLTMRPREQWALAFDPPLDQQIRLQLEDGEARYAGYVEGRVFCFKCESAACEHSLPPTPLSVFDGYDSTGTACWRDLAQKLVDAQHEEVDGLFRRRPAVLNLLQFGKELKSAQLASFGRASKTYAVLGQVAVGYLTLPRDRGARGASDRRFAVTFQVVETRGRAGRFDLRLNTLVHPGLVPDTTELFDGEWAPWLRRARLQAMEQLAQIQGMAANAREEQDSKRFHTHMAKVGGVLRKLSRSLTRGDRQSKRRTRHAEARGQDGARPTDKAYADAEKVEPGNLFWEERNRTYVVYHPQGRAHIFGEDGRHVTSFTIKPDAKERRLRTRRWAPVDTAKFDAFRTSRAGA